MIKPRPTIHIWADPFGLYTIGNRQDDWGRKAADCPHCGAHLSRYRSLGDIACAPCQQRLDAPPDPLDLHPVPYDDSRNGRWRKNGIDTCHCGGKKDKRAHQCRNCRYNLHQGAP